MNDIELREVTMENFRQIILLELNDVDRKMVASNIYSLAEAYADKVSKPRGIYDGDTLVGFVMYNYSEPEKRGYISRLMVDKNHQRKGYGRIGLSLALDDLKTYEGIEEIQISYHPDNKKAKPLYKYLGFVENGDFVDGEAIAILDLRKEKR